MQERRGEEFWTNEWNVVVNEMNRIDCNELNEMTLLQVLSNELNLIIDITSVLNVVIEGNENKKVVFIGWELTCSPLNEKYVIAVNDYNVVDYWLTGMLICHFCIRNGIKWCWELNF